MQVTKNPDFLSVDDLRRYLGVSRQTLHRIRNNPDQPFPKPVTFGGCKQGRLTWHREVIDEWVKTGSVSQSA